MIEYIKEDRLFARNKTVIRNSNLKHLGTRKRRLIRGKKETRILGWFG